MPAASASDAPLPNYTVADFLVTAPPTTLAVIEGLVNRQSNAHSWFLFIPDIVLHCTSGRCDGNRIWQGSTNQGMVSEKRWYSVWLTYTCRNCRTQMKSYALHVYFEDPAGAVTRADGRAIKVGEWPAFGPPVPSRVISLIGPDRELFLKGRRSENQGLGIAAFAYYRRIVENQKSRLLSEIAKVAQRVGTSADVVSVLEAARTETQFSRAVDMVKDAIPESLRVQGHNPLLLLHRALSEGLHAQSDEECLASAQAVRVVLTDLAERIGQALQDHAELAGAVSRLLRDPRRDNSPQGDEAASAADLPDASA